MHLPARRLFTLTLVVTTLAAALLWRGGGNATAVGPDVTATESSAPELSVLDAPPALVAGLQPGLERALVLAVSAASAEGHSLAVTSGFRTAAEQERLLAAAIEERGSEEEALRWVFTPERSMHVQGFAVDVGDGPAADWLDEHGARFGLCRTLRWEWWHFEWRAAWEESASCPEPVDDPADAPDRSGR